MIIGSMDSAVFSQTRINFARGKNSATVSGTVPIKLSREYVLGAKKGQVMTVRLTANSPEAFVDVEGRDLGKGGTITLPATDNNIRITIYGDRRKPTKFTLSVSIR